MKSMRYMKPGRYFTQEETQQFLNIKHNKKEIGDIVVYDFKTGDYDPSYLNPLFHVTLVEVKKQIDPYSDEYVEYMLGTDYFKGIGFYINSEHAEHITELISRLADFDKDSALKMLDRYQQTFVQSKEAVEYSNKVLKEANIIIDYLLENNIKVNDLNINIEALNKLGDNEDELEKALDKISENFPKPIKIEGYNDLDYYPFLFEDIYVIEDVSADRMLICKKEEDKTSWYQVERWCDRYKMHDWVSDFFYENHQLPKLHLNNLSEFDLIAEYDGNELKKATIGIDYLNLLQGYIFDLLAEDKKIKKDLPDLSFEELLQHYTFQKEVWHIEERAIVQLLQKIQTIDGKMTYEDFGTVDSALIKKTNRNEAIAEHHLRDLVPPKEPTMYPPDFSGLKNLEPKHRDSINEYLNKLQERDNTEMTAKFIELIQGKLQENTQTKKTKNKM